MDKKELIQLSNIRFGTYAKANNIPGIPCIQAKNFDTEGELQSELIDSFVKETDMKREDFLKDGDVVYTGKGNRLLAWVYREDFGTMTVSSLFYIISVDKMQISPDYLALYLNFQSTRDRMLKKGAFTTVFSMRKNELEKLQIPLPTLKQQEEITALSDLHRKERRLMQEIILSRKQLNEAIIKHLIGESHD